LSFFSCFCYHLSSKSQLSSSLCLKYSEMEYLNHFLLFFTSKTLQYNNNKIPEHLGTLLNTEKNSSFFSVWLFKKNTMTTIIFSLLILTKTSLKSCQIQVKEQWAVRAAMSSVCFQTSNSHTFQIQLFHVYLFLHSPRFTMISWNLIHQEHSSNVLANMLIIAGFCKE